MANEPNPIERRRLRLRDQWLAFERDHEARLLHWVFEPGDERMFEAFLEVEAHEDSDNDDLFIQLDAPFLGDGHGHALATKLGAFYDLLRDDLIEDGLVDASWKPPKPADDDPHGCQTLAATIASFRAHHQPLFRHVVLVLSPTRVASAAGWAAWITEMLAHVDAPQTRLIAVDDAQHPLLAGVAEESARWVRTVRAELDMPGAVEEISEQAGRLDQPDGAYRHAFVELGHAVGRSDMAAAQAHGDRALAIALEQGWTHLVVAVHFALGAGWLSQRDPTRAIETYEAAERACIEGDKTDPHGVLPGLRIKVRMAKGAALVTAGSYEAAATVYEDTAVLAHDAGDVLMTLESHRMAGYAHERAGAFEASWNANTRALAVSEQVNEEDRQRSTLPFIGEAMLRLAQHDVIEADGSTVDTRMRTLAGAGWRERATLEGLDS